MSLFEHSNKVKGNLLTQDDFLRLQFTSAYILINRRFFDYERNQPKTLNQLVPHLEYGISGVRCFPVFSDAQRADEQKKIAGIDDEVVKCDYTLLRLVIQQLLPPAITINPTGKTRRESTLYNTMDFIDALSLAIADPER